MKYVFGPVNSRRLGVSLGIDIVPFKVCSFNCVYCECGSTTELTGEVKEYLPYDGIISEIKEALDRKPVLDVITFSGSGEPTLNSRLGDLIRFIKKNYPEYKVAVLTNSSGLHRADVRENLLQADILYPSLDAVSENVFNRIMRPLPGVDPAGIVDSIALFRKEFKGKLCLEIFIIEGINDTEDELQKLKEACIKIVPDEIHLNHLDRPGAEEWVKPAGITNMERVKNYFYPLPVKLIRRDPGKTATGEYFDEYEKCVLNAVQQNGSTAEELSGSLGMRLFDVLRALKSLQQKGEVAGTAGEKNTVFIPRSTGQV